MPNLDPWSSFFQSGSVLDYLRYKAYENAAKTAKSGEKYQEDNDETYYEGLGYQGAEFR